MRRVLLGLVLLLGFHVQAGAQAQPIGLPTSVLCPAPTPQFTIDLSNKATEGKTHYRVSDQALILFKRKNPFLYEYKISIQAKPVPEPDLALFFRLFNASPTASIIAEVAKLGVPKSTTNAIANFAQPDDSCALGPQEANMLSRHTSLPTDFALLKAEAKTIEDHFDRLKGEIALEEITLEGEVVCEVLVEAARHLVTAIDTAFDGSASSLGQKLVKFSGGLENLKKGIDEQAKDIAEARTRLTENNCGAKDINSLLDPFEKTLKDLRTGSDGMQKFAADSAKAAEDVQTEARIVRNVLNNPDSFSETRKVSGFTEITEVDIIVERKSKKATGATFSSYVEEKLRFGGRQRFALAVGAAFTPLDQKTYTIIQNVDGNTVTRAVGFKDNASQRVAPLIMLHTRIADTGWNGSYLHFSFGFAGATDDNGVNLEYLLGPSVSFAEERFFVTVGGYIGRIERLQDGFEVGTALPPTVTSVPTARDRGLAWGFAATYKFR